MVPSHRIISAYNRPAVAETGYRFGPFVVDRTRYRVRRDGAPLELTPKLLDLLLHLLEHAGELVTKEQLLDALWPDANVTDNAIAQAVSELRDALDDEVSTPRFIKTVARRGYRFIAPVDSVDTADSVHLPAPAGQPPTSPPTVAALAVLDFTNVTGDRNTAWLSAGIAETVSGDIR
jgi:DNA-binding winged helix-turn-helix (wHTH) protein